MHATSSRQLTLFEPATTYPVLSPMPAAEVIATVGPLLQLLLQEIANAESGMLSAEETDEAGS